MYRIRGPSEVDSELEDKVKLVNDDGSGSECTLQEETHIVPHPLKLFKRKVVTRATSPHSKLVYWWTAVIVLGTSALLLVLTPLLVERSLKTQDCSDIRGDYGNLPFFYDPYKNGSIELCRNGRVMLKGYLGMNRAYISEVKVNVFTHSMNTTLNISTLPNKNRNCLRVQWVGLSSQDNPLQDCYDVGSSHWYGAYEHINQYWPLNTSMKSSPFLPHDYLSPDQSSNGSFGPILHPLWLNTNGVGIIVDEGVQLHISTNATHLCLLSKPFELDCFPDALDYAFLNYTVCIFDTVAQTAQYFLNESNFISRPNSTPDAVVFQKPIWSTWAEYKTNITTEEVAGFCSSILDNGFDVSQLEIDDGYMEHYGELSFKPALDMKHLFSNTSCQHFDVSVWVHPFVNYDASNFAHGLSTNMYLPGYSIVEGSSVSLVRWWQGYGAVLNFVDIPSAEDHAQALLEFSTFYGITSFKFDAGEYTYLPKCVYIKGLNHPGDFTKAYVSFVSSQSYSSRSEVRVGYFTQNHPLLVRILDRTSSWEADDNGLRSVLSAVLSVGLGGYTFVIPDMIGGNGRDINMLHSTDRPDPELYIRWAQLSTFLPVMQFSITPWGYGDANLTRHINSLTQLHASLNFSVFARESLETRFPIIRPLWWRAVLTNDEATWTISDQFYIGDTFMVAPVLEQGTTHRRVYFPLGANYKVASSPVSAASVCPDGVCTGGSSLDFNVPLYRVLYFSIIAVDE